MPFIPKNIKHGKQDQDKEYWFRYGRPKEAILKASGLGIRLDLNSLNTQVHPTEWRNVSSIIGYICLSNFYFKSEDCVDSGMGQSSPVVVFSFHRLRVVQLNQKMPAIMLAFYLNHDDLEI